MTREIVFDTETTGKRYQDKHRVVEIAAVELIDGVPTGREFQTYINPDMVIPDDVIAIHGITNDMVATAPRFREIVPKLVEFFRGAVTVAHNSDFDEKFINHELQLCDYPESFWNIVEDTVDTIEMSRKIWTGTKGEDGKRLSHSLDAVLDRCGIDRSERVLHGALIDSTLLARAYTHMKQMIIDMGPTLEDDVPAAPIKRLTLKTPLPKIVLTEDEVSAHMDILSSLAPKTTSGPKA